MSDGTPRNVAASIRDRLLRLARTRGEDHQLLLMRYAGERLLYRLSLSPHRERFVLKGAKLFEFWTGDLHRPTRDLDFLGRGSPDVSDLIAVFREVCAQPVPTSDGLTFPPDRITGAPAREDQEYQGASLRLEARLDNAAIPLQLDFGFGDAVIRPPELSTLPTLLEQPPPILRTYPRETVVAEKFQAMVSLGIANSRMKDFYDLWYLAQEFDFDGATLSAALAATFQRRETPLPTQAPLAFTAEFYEDRDKRTQWSAFVKRSRLRGAGTSLEEVAEVLRTFLIPPMLAAERGESFAARWSAAGGAWEISVAE